MMWYQHAPLLWCCIFIDTSTFCHAFFNGSLMHGSAWIIFIREYMSLFLWLVSPHSRYKLLISWDCFLLFIHICNYMWIKNLHSPAVIITLVWQNCFVQNLLNYGSKLVYQHTSCENNIYESFRVKHLR